VAAVQEEVAALPSTGYGSGNGSTLAWSLALAAALVSLGGATAVVARRNG
jgi:hypothetical protein